MRWKARNLGLGAGLIGAVFYSWLRNNSASRSEIEVEERGGWGGSRDVREKW